MATKSENIASDTTNTMNEKSQDVPLGQSSSNEKRTASVDVAGDTLLSNDPVTVIGIYGVPGSGKTFLMNHLKKRLYDEGFLYYEGSEVLATFVEGGLAAFKKLPEEEKIDIRQSAIASIKGRCKSERKTGIVNGHFMFWPEKESQGTIVWTQADGRIFTHILYLDTAPATISQQVEASQADRPDRRLVPSKHIKRWQGAEKESLRNLCRENRIEFLPVQDQSEANVEALVQNFRQNNESSNQSLALSKVDELVSNYPKDLETMLVFDADKTLSSADTGAMFWKKVSERQKMNLDPLKEVFNSRLGYSYTAFRQVAWVYEEYADVFDAICDEVASEVALYDDVADLLRKVESQRHMGVVVVTCGLRQIWEKVLKNEGVHPSVKVIGSERVSENFVVTPVVKAYLVDRLQTEHKMYVCAFGDGPVDLPMLNMADRAVVVVGEETSRSKSMEGLLMKAINDEGLDAQQVLQPATVSARLTDHVLPVVSLADKEFVNDITARRFHFYSSNGNPAALSLQTPARDPAISGVALRETHRRIGWYLATQYLTDVIGLEQYDMTHVTGNKSTDGYRLKDEENILIVPLMRGGEPMAFGVSDAFPKAVFFHAKKPTDIEEKHVQGISTIVLVDAIVNTGASIVEFVEHIHSNFDPFIRIVVVAMTVQADCVAKSSSSIRALARASELSLVTLRTSEAKYKGKGGTDTGNRLFNTTHWD